MSKGKRCDICNNGKMRRNYIRSHWKGIRFTEKHIAGIETKKGSFKPIGWICDNCGILNIDENNYIMFLESNKRKENQEKVLKELKEKINNLENELNEYQEKYIYTERDIKIEKRFILYRHYNLKSATETYHYLKGLKDGYKQNNEFHKQEIESLKLTDNEILKKAKLINSKRKLGYT